MIGCNSLCDIFAGNMPSIMFTGMSVSIPIAKDREVEDNAKSGGNHRKND